MNKLISMRFEDKFLKEVDKFVKESTYSNRTDAFKAGVRKLIDDYYLNKRLREGLGSWKRAGIKEPTSEEFEKIREDVGRKSLKEAGLL